jgi:acyl carrier protein
VTRQDVEAAVRRALTSVAPEVDAPSLKATVPIRDQVDLDSFDFLNFVVALHGELDVDVPEADYGKLTTLDSAVGYLCQRRDRAGRPTTP